jgi:hypothetical protein
MLRNLPEERRSPLLRGESLKSRKERNVFVQVIAPFVDSLELYWNMTVRLRWQRISASKLTHTR